MNKVTARIIKGIALLMSFLSMLFFAYKAVENKLPNFEDELSS